MFFTINTLTDEGEIGPQYAHRRGGHLFKLNGKNLHIYRESISEDHEVANNSPAPEGWDSRGEINYFDSDDVFIAAFFPPTTLCYTMATMKMKRTTDWSHISSLIARLVAVADERHDGLAGDATNYAIEFPIGVKERPTAIANLRKQLLRKFQEDPPIGVIPAELQDDRIGSLNSLYKARRIHLDGVTRYSLVNALGLRGYT